MKDKSTSKNSIRQIPVEFLLENKLLTPRQLQIVRLFPSDLCDKQIADILHISISTLNSHKAAIFEKFNVRSKSGLITEAFHSKIIN